MSKREAMERFERDVAYVEEHRQELLERYPEQWIAVHSGEVLGAEDDLERLVERVRKKGYHPGDVYHIFLTRQKLNLVLTVARP